MGFGTRLKRIRKDVGLTQEEISDVLHISRSSISKLENDLADLKASTLYQWGRVVALFRTGQASSVQEITAAMLSSVDNAVVADVIMKVLGG